MRIILLIIDPQEDFHDTKGSPGSLPVRGSTEDSERITDMIKENKQHISEVFVTMDSHHRNHIAHAVFWDDGQGKKPEPFSEVLHEQVVSGHWQPVDHSLLEYCKNYTQQLEEKKRFTLTIWPEHCLIGTMGHCIIENIHGALQEWSEFHMKTVNYIMKGMNCLTEMYSAIEAEVPIPTDPLTTRNIDLLRKLRNCERLIVCGQAKSHCVNFTLRDIVDDWINHQCSTSRIYFLTDGASPVTGFEKNSDEFVEDMRRKNVTISTCAEAFRDIA